MRIIFILFFALTFHGLFSQLVIDKYAKIETNAYINFLSIDKDNYIWVCTSEGISKIGNTESDPQKLLPGKNIKCITHDHRLGTIASDGKKIYKVDGSNTWNIEGDGLEINDLEVYKGRIYVATNNGLQIIAPSNNRIEIINTRNSKLKSDHINFIHLDTKDILWLGTENGEVRIEDDKWKVYHPKINVTDHFENREGLWFIGDGEMWLVDYFNREYNAGLNAELYAGNLNDFAIDSEGRLYVASDKLVRYDPYNEEIKAYSSDAGLLSKKCTSIACDQNDNIWIGTGGTGLYRLVFGDAAVAKFNAICLLEKGISCSNDADAKIKVSVTGGKEPYNFEWSDEGMKGDNPRNIAEGDYKVTVTDAIQNEFVASISVKKPSPITLDLKETKRISGPGRRDGALIVEAKGGTGELNYRWSNGERKGVNDNLTAGTYTLTVTDDNRCSAEATFEVQKEKFIPELDISTLEVGKTLRINELYFTADSTDVTTESYEVLEEILEFLNANPSIVVEIGGHTNTLPSHSYCDELSSERARTIAEFFYDNGISNKRLSYKGYGKRNPITVDQSLAGRKRNQRVEIKILAI